MTKDRSTPENRAYWDFVEQTAAEVRTWPAWMRGEVMPDVRKMTNGQLLMGVSFYTERAGKPEFDELAKRIGIMEELCEACEVVPKEELNDVPDSRWARWWSAFLAYRAMKGE